MSGGFFDNPSSIAAQAKLDDAAEAAAERDAMPSSPFANSLYAPKPEYVDKTVTETQRAERVESVGRALYSAQSTYGAMIPDDANDVLDVRAAREVAADYQVDATDASELVSMMRQLPQVSEDDRAKWHADSVALNIPREDLERARAFVARDPRVFDLLERSGLGNHPRVVQRVVHLAREHAIRGGK